MRILIIRHAEPDYTVDGLTEKGKREAALLAQRLKDTPMDRIYLSPKGRSGNRCPYPLPSGPRRRDPSVAGGIPRTLF